MKHQLVRDPWNVIDAILDKSTWRDNHEVDLGFGWPQFMITDSSVGIKSRATGEPYPSHLVKTENQEFHVTELPGPSIMGDAAREEQLEVSQDAISPSFVTIKYPLWHSVETQPGDDTISIYETFFDRLLNETLFIVRQELKVDRPRSPSIFWRDLLGNLKSNYDNDPAKHALIVDLAEPITEPIDYITSRPKRILQRVRDQQRIQNVQEIDTHCVVDLARRPGYTLAEKAGPKQRILAIKRRESIDVLENRVTLHCCKLLEVASTRYLSAHKDIEGSKRKELVDSLYRCIKRMPLKGSFRGVGRLEKPCRHPNYTLMQNVHYAKIWQAYSQLVRNEELRDTIWRWARRLWSEYAGVYLADTLLGLADNPLLHIFVEAGEKVVQAESRPFFGKWLLKDIMPGPFILGKRSGEEGTLYLLDRDSCGAQWLGTEWLSLLNADYVLIWFTNNGRKVLPIYARLTPTDAEFGDSRQSLSELAEETLMSIEKYNRHSDLKSVGAWILHGYNSFKSLVDGHQLKHQQLYCWQSAPLPDPNSWSMMGEHRFTPLLGLVGVK